MGSGHGGFGGHFAAAHGGSFSGGPAMRGGQFRNNFAIGNRVVVNNRFGFRHRFPFRHRFAFAASPFVADSSCWSWWYGRRIWVCD
jgi:hypothetical protein